MLSRVAAGRTPQTAPSRCALHPVHAGPSRGRHPDSSTNVPAGDKKSRIDRLYAVNTDGFSFLRHRSDGRLEGPPVRALSDQTGWRHFGVTSGGVLVAAADPVATGGAHDIQIHRLQAPPLPPVVEFQIPTDGNAEAVVIRDGLAYVADGDAGLLVLRFQDADRAGRPPTVTLSSSTGGTTALENQRVTVTAAAVDDVGTARVEFLVDGQPVATDDAENFEVQLPAAGRYVLAVTRGGDGRSFRVNMTISAVP